VVGAEVEALGEVVVAGCSFMLVVALMAIEKYEVRYPLLAVWYSLLEFASGGSRRSSGREWWKRTRMTGAEVGGLGEVVVAGCSFIVGVDGDRKI
jgi:hypothetical protein